MENNIYAYRYLELNNDIENQAFLYYRYFDEVLISYRQLRNALEIIAYLSAHKLKQLQHKGQSLGIYIEKKNRELIYMDIRLQKASDNAKYLFYYLMQLVRGEQRLNMPLIMIAVKVEFDVKNRYKQLELW